MPRLTAPAILQLVTQEEVEGVRGGGVPDDAAGGRDDSLEPPGAEGLTKRRRNEMDAYRVPNLEEMNEQQA